MLLALVLPIGQPALLGLTLASNGTEESSEKGSEKGSEEGSREERSETHAQSGRERLPSLPRRQGTLCVLDLGPPPVPAFRARDLRRPVLASLEQTRPLRC